MFNTVQRVIKGISITVVTLLLFGCAQQETEQKTKLVDKGPTVKEAVATIWPAEGDDVTGTVRFTQTSEGVEVEARLNNLAQGKHGFHIHQKGDCSNRKDFTSAGGHYNPTGDPHGAPTADQRHIGDLGNVPAGPEGSADITYTDNFISLNGKHSIVGRSIIVHKGEDDLKTQPSGASGARIGCGVIGIVEAEKDTAAGGNGDM